MLQAENLTYERFFEPVFEPVSFSVAASSLLLVSGANGCGKTTLLRVLAGFLQPTHGSLACEVNQPLYVGHQLALKEDLSVSENLAFMHRFMTGGGGDVGQAVEQIGLAAQAHQSTRSLSAGQRKRCALARLLLCPARLWLLDEPYANLDPAGMALMDGLLRTHLDDGGACVMTTHGTLQPQDIEWQACAMQAGVRR